MTDDAADRVDDRPLLFTFDVTDTIADIDGVSHIDLIDRVSPRSRPEIRHVLYERLGLKTLPSRTALTPTLIDDTCAELGITREQFPFGSIPLAPYRLRPDAVAAVATAARYLTTALITNTSVFADPGLRPVAEGLKPFLAAIHASWAMGAAKPDPKAFRRAAAFHGLAVSNLIHVGNSWREDVAPVLALGARAVWLNPGRIRVPGATPLPFDRLIVATTLREAVGQAIAHWMPPRQRHDGPVRNTGRHSV